MVIILGDNFVNINFLYFAVLFLVGAYLWRKGFSVPYLIWFIIFGLYLYFALSKTLFPVPYRGVESDLKRQMHFFQRVNLIPFYFGQGGLNRETLTSAFNNIILTVPFGFLGYLVLPVRARRIPWFVFFAGVMFEGLQLCSAVALGFLYRVLDINDLIFNLLGALLGWGCYWLLAWFIRSYLKPERIPAAGLWVYLYDAAHSQYYFYRRR